MEFISVNCRSCIFKTKIYFLNVTAKNTHNMHHYLMYISFILIFKLIEMIVIRDGQGSSIVSGQVNTVNGGLTRDAGGPGSNAGVVHCIISLPIIH